MFQSYRILLWVIALGVVVALTGCGSRASQEKQKPTTPAGSTTQEAPAEKDEHTGHEGHEHHANHGEHSDHAADDDHANANSTDALTGLAELSASDRAAAEKQRVCPVSGDVLGAMGKPYKVIVKGRTVFLCCPACEKQLTKNPDKYLAKIEAGKPE